MYTTLVSRVTAGRSQPQRRVRGTRARIAARTRRSSRRSARWRTRRLRRSGSRRRFQDLRRLRRPWSIPLNKYLHLIAEVVVGVAAGSRCARRCGLGFDHILLVHRRHCPMQSKALQPNSNLLLPITRTQTRSLACSLALALARSSLGMLAFHALHQTISTYT